MRNTELLTPYIYVILLSFQIGNDSTIYKHFEMVKEPELLPF